MNPAAIGSFDLAGLDIVMQTKGVEHQSAESGLRRENFFHRASQQFAARPAEKTFDCCTHEHYPRITREQHQTILQAGHDLVHVVLQGGEDFASVAHLFSQMRNLETYFAVFIGAGGRAGQLRSSALSHSVETAVDMFQRTKSEVGKQRGKDQRTQYRNSRKRQLALQPWREFVAQKYGRNADVNTAKRLPVQHERQVHIVDSRRIVNHAQFSPETRLLQLRKVGPVGNLFPNEVGISIENRFAIGVEHGSVINCGEASDYRIEYGIEVAIGPQVVRNAAAHCFRVGGVHAGAA